MPGAQAWPPGHRESRLARKSKEAAQATREAILDAAEHVFERDGVPATTLQGIGAEAGVTRGAIYWHFRDKDDLLNAMVARTQFPLEDLRRARELARHGDALLELRRIAEDSLLRMADSPGHQRVYRILLLGCVRVGRHPQVIDAEEAVRAELRRSVTALFETARAQGTLAPGLAPETAAWSFMSYMRGLFSEWLLQPGNLDLRDQRQALLEVFFAGVRAPA